MLTSRPLLAYSHASLRRRPKARRGPRVFTFYSKVPVDGRAGAHILHLFHVPDLRCPRESIGLSRCGNINLLHGENTWERLQRNYTDAQRHQFKSSKPERCSGRQPRISLQTFTCHVPISTRSFVSLVIVRARIPPEPAPLWQSPPNPTQSRSLSSRLRRPCKTVVWLPRLSPCTWDSSIRSCT
jgi:hypothetical protein